MFHVKQFTNVSLFCHYELVSESTFRSCLKPKSYGNYLDNINNITDFLDLHFSLLETNSWLWKKKNMVQKF